jgi:hypothetical protein
LDVGWAPLFLEANPGVLFILLASGGFTFDLLDGKGKHASVAQGTSALYLDQATLAEIGLAMVTVCNALLIWVVGTTHDCHLCWE